MKDGVNLIGYIKSEHGLGEACRLTADALSETDLDWAAYDWEINNPSRQTDSTWDKYIQKNIGYNISIFNINADQLQVAREQLPQEAWLGYRIGIWYWELTEFPKQWMNAFKLVDEIWAPTKFIQDNLKKVSSVPVLYMPPGIRREAIDEKYNREYFNLPKEHFLFLNFFDAYSYTSRKNPFAAINAFKKAFSPDDNSVGLVLKVNNASMTDDSISELRKAIEEYSNIFIIAKTMSRGEVNGLIGCCDASVSLHRSEGLGLLCEESMYYGKPVIATNWSGNTDFMTEESACLVDYTLIPIGEYYGTNDPNQKWAEADICQASRYMVKLKSDKEFYNKIAINAKNHIHTNFSSEVCGARMEKRLKEILQEKDKWEKRSLIEELGAVEQPESKFVQEKAMNTNPVKKLIKKAITKVFGFLFQPIYEQQQRFYNEQQRFYNEQQQLKELVLHSSDHSIQAAGSLYNAIYQRVTSMEKLLSQERGGRSAHIEKEFIENKWQLIDKYYHEPRNMICSICGEHIDTEIAEKKYSEDIYGGGKLLRYKCPCCGAIIGPNKMWELTEEELSEEYKFHYMVNSEGQTTDAEIEVFMDMKPEKGRKYLNYGCGAWTSTIDKLRELGYDVYGFDAYAPVTSKYIITDFAELEKMQFDGIFSHDLLEHLRYPVSTFEIFRSLLKDGGIMAHSTACYKYVYEYDRFHLVFYTGKAVEKLCERTGFELIEKIEDNDRLSYNYIYKKANKHLNSK